MLVSDESGFGLKCRLRKQDKVIVGKGEKDTVPVHNVQSSDTKNLVNL